MQECPERGDLIIIEIMKIMKIIKTMKTTLIMTQVCDGGSEPQCRDFEIEECSPAQVMILCIMIVDIMILCMVMMMIMIMIISIMLIEINVYLQAVSCKQKCTDVFWCKVCNH